ncbi:MAG: iron-containing alcohol dehydrogenase family protein [Spirulina sp. SIO3F2]|nr:iron-containing alcohol dehydrogenase family protein [Spirulina sp. SIO3F2]
MIQQLTPPTTSSTTAISLSVAPRQLIKGSGVIQTAGEAIAALGQRPLVVGGEQTLAVVNPQLNDVLTTAGLAVKSAQYTPDCSESSLAQLQAIAQQHQADVIIGVGGGKALDTAKLLAYYCQIPVITIPTSAATCAAWTGLSNVYSDAGAFRYDVGLSHCPDLLILDYELLRAAPRRLLVAGIGDAIAKWYEASVSSGESASTLIIAAVQQARVLRDLLLQKSATALESPGSEIWQEVVDATVLLAGVIGGLGGAQCRTVAAHAVHNGLTQIPAAHDALHGEKVAYGILVQLRLEEQVKNNQLAQAARQQLLQFYEAIALPKTLEDLGLGEVTLAELRQAAEFACQPESDIHHLPFAVTPEQLLSAMVSTTSD